MGADSLCGDPEGMEEKGTQGDGMKHTEIYGWYKRKGIYVYLWLIHVEV